MRRPKPPVVGPAPAPSSLTAPPGVVVLFDGANLDAWRSADGGPARWRVRDGHFEVVPGAGTIESVQKFGDVQLHVEWAAPAPPRGKGQGRGNSGVFLAGKYELQVLDSFQADTYADGQAASIYGEFPPLFNATRPPGQWQTYDVAFRRPRFGPKGEVLEPARLTLIHNGVVVQNNEELLGETSWIEWEPYSKNGDRGPIQLQDHGHPVRFRNIWARPLPDRPAPTAEDLKRPKVVALSDEQLDVLAGQYAMGAGRDGPAVTVRRAEGRLKMKLPFRPRPLELLPISPTDFVLPRSDADVHFEKDKAGRVTGARFHVGDGGGVLTRTGP